MQTKARMHPVIQAQAVLRVTAVAAVLKFLWSPGLIGCDGRLATQSNTYSVSTYPIGLPHIDLQHATGYSGYSVQGTRGLIGLCNGLHLNRITDDGTAAKRRDGTSTS